VSHHRIVAPLVFAALLVPLSGCSPSAVVERREADARREMRERAEQYEQNYLAELEALLAENP
jgi:hypothetical protein